MTSIASVNSAALLILQQTGPIANSTQSGGADTDILKIANGSKSTVSSEPSKASTQAAAAAGKFAVDTAPAEGTENVGYQMSSNDGGLSERMALAASAEYTAPSEEETIKRANILDKFLVDHGLNPLNESFKASLIKNRAL